MSKDHRGKPRPARSRETRSKPTHDAPMTNTKTMLHSRRSVRMKARDVGVRLLWSIVFDAPMTNTKTMLHSRRTPTSRAFILTLRCRTRIRPPDRLTSVMLEPLQDPAAYPG